MRGHIRKRGSSWSIAVSLGKDPITGKRNQKTFSGYKTEKEAEKALAKIIYEYNSGMYVEPSKITLSEFLENWLEVRVQRTVRPSTFDSYSRAIKKRIIPALGNLTLQKLNVLHIENFISDLSKENLTPEYITYIHAILRTALYQAVRWEILQKNPAASASPPRIPKRVPKVWNQQQVKLFLENAREGKSNYYIVYLLAIWTGMRRGEILGLRWKDIDLEAGTISIVQNLVYTGKRLLIQEPKTPGSIRTVTISPFVVKELRNYKETQNQQKQLLGPAYEDNDLVIVNEMGNPLHPRSLSGNYGNLIKKLNLDRIRFHDLRHVHATLLLKIGEHPKVVSERLGHSNTKMTMDTYSHVTSNMQREASLRFENFIQGN